MNIDEKTIEIHNLRLINERLMEKLYLVTGCKEFGDLDGMEGTCVYCCELNPQLFYRCELFRDSFMKHWKKCCEEYLKNLNNKTSDTKEFEEF